MKQKKRFLCVVIFLAPLLILAQNNPSPLVGKSAGINWTAGLTWEQVKAKAKSEKKYIFVDAFATWCGPCKLMDKEVYTNDTVANYFNERFIAVKVQMDQTEKDSDYVKAWYSTAKEFAKHYRIEGYPTLIFLSPDAELIDKEAGGKGTRGLITMAEKATRSLKKYQDQYTAYDSLVNNYKEGKRDFDKMPYMILVAYRFGDYDLGNRLLKEHTEYVKALSPDARYTKANIEMWSSFYFLNRSGAIFHFFQKDGKLINKVMSHPGFAEAVIDKTIQNTIVDSFYRMQRGETTLINGKTVMNSEVMAIGQLPVRMDGQINTDNVEADWRKLYQMLVLEFDKQTSKRNVLLARIKWYKQHQNKIEEAKYTLQLYHKYPPDIKTMNIAEINGFAWNVFLYVPSSEKKMIRSTLGWAKKALEINPVYLGMIDTYANLLYKAGRTREAIRWEEKGLSIAESEKARRAANGELPLSRIFSPEQFKLIVDQMKRGERTYTREGAMWN
jgi:thiol-disulfide isomerase/thioredoxin